MNMRLVLLGFLALVIPACGGSSGGAPPVTPGDIPGVFRITAKGGAGTDGYGGNGSNLYIYGEYTASDLSILKTGTVNATSNVHAIKPNLGTDPRIVTGTETVNLANYFSNNRLEEDPLAPGTAATGLWVKPGAILILAPNRDTDNADADLDLPLNGDGYWTGTREEVNLWFPDGVFIEGEVRVLTKDGSTDLADLNLQEWIVTGPGGSGFTIRGCENFVTTTSGKVVTAGTDGLSGFDGTQAGWVFVLADSTVVNVGLVDSTGGDGDTGGDGADVTFYVNYYGCYNTGIILANGGRGSVNNGGNGGDVEMETGGSTQGPICNEGTIRSIGGTGATYGGDGGDVYLYVDSGTVGAGTNAGTIDCSGGASTGDGNGGDGGDVDMDSYNGSLRVSGPITTRGGAGAGTGYGGSGGYIELYGYQGTGAYIGGNELSPLGVFVGANLDVSGGNGVDGGNAGYVTISNSTGGGSATIVPGKAPIFLVGYEAINLSGGDGTEGGGGTGDDGYYSYAYLQYEPYNSGLGTYFPVGNVFNEVPWTIRGGNGINEDAGYGGNLYFGRYDSDNIFPEPEGFVENTADIDLRGGSSTGDDGGNGAGSFWLECEYEVRNSGDIDISGGDGFWDGGDCGFIYFKVYEDGIGITNSGALTAKGGNGANDDGGAGGNVDFDTDIDSSKITNTAGINTSGGTGANLGGDAGYIDIERSREVHNTANLTLRGGDGGDGDGGSGGTLWMYSRFKITHTGDVNADGGDSATGNGGSNQYQYVFIFTEDEDRGDDSSIDPTKQTGVVIQGNIHQRGGTGAYGGSGGWGGNSSYGGTAGGFYCYDYASVKITGNLDFSGGDSNDWNGGYAGSIEIYSEGTVTITGNIDINGGEGINGNGGHAYYTTQIGGRRLNFTGILSQVGGSTGAPAAYGGSGGNILLLSTEAPSNIHGTVTVAAGQGDPDGVKGTIILDGLPLVADTITF